MTRPAKATPGKSWPRMYLLNIYKQAVERGYIWLGPISEADAASLKMAIYRLRRRSDSSNAAIISEQYHMVTVGEWQHGVPDYDAGRLPVIYSALPCGSQLPGLTDAATGEALPSILEAPAAQPALQPPAALPTAFEPLPITTSVAIEQLDNNLDIDDYLSSMISSAKKASPDD